MTLLRTVLVLSSITLAACGGSPSSDRDGATDAAPVDVVAADRALDVGASDDGADAASSDVTTDVGDGTCAYGHCECVDLSWCENRSSLAPGTTLAMQDIAAGGYGDCTFCASCSGGKNLFYGLRIPAGRVMRVTATPLTSGTDLLLRVLSACSLTAATQESARGGGLTNGSATLCLANAETTERSVIVAVGIYGGPPTHFDVSAEEIASGGDCLP